MVKPTEQARVHLAALPSMALATLPGHVIDDGESAAAVLVLGPLFPEGPWAPVCSGTGSA